MRTAYIVAVLFITACSPKVDQSTAALASRQKALDIASNFMQTGDTI